MLFYGWLIFKLILWMLLLFFFWFVNPSIHSFIYLFTHWYIDPFSNQCIMHPYIHRFIHSLTHSLTHSSHLISSHLTHLHTWWLSSCPEILELSGEVQSKGWTTEGPVQTFVVRLIKIRSDKTLWSKSCILTPPPPPTLDQSRSGSACHVYLHFVTPIS